ncbi:MAG: YIP1 family protein [Anaerolineae bacterium]|nr:YIP1 family protein [Anaerolineae bacterium]
MLTERIMSAFTFKKEVYADVEKDKAFTSTAWLIVVVVAFLSQLGAQSSGGFFKWIIAAIIGTVFTVAGFALAALIISWAGRQFFSADVDFEEMVRTLGLAYVWNIVGVIGIVGLISPAMVCVLSPIQIIAGVLGFVSSLIAAKEALDLEWVQTIITVIIGAVAQFIVMAVAGVFLGILGLTSAGVGNALLGG